MPVTHEPWLVALSIAVAIQGAYVGLGLAVQVAAAVGVRRRIILAGAALSLGVAIWSMHFVAMLAAHLPFRVNYLVLPTLLSFLVCVIVVGVAVFAASAGTLTLPRLMAAAVFMGLGIVAMHYIGMWALHASAHMTHDVTLVVASVSIAVAASGLALLLAGGRRGRPPLILSATALGGAIAGMHYTAMAALNVTPHGNAIITAPSLSTDLLAIVVAVVAFGVSGIFLLTLVRERPAGSVPAGARTSRSPPSPASPEQLFLLHHQPAAERRLPVIRDGITQFLPVKNVVAVHANAHYTYIFDGTSKLFCPLPISQVEARLDHSHFIRVHRSHIVNLERVVGLKRDRDHGVIELAGYDSYVVPVSRSRFGGLKAQLNLHAM